MKKEDNTIILKQRQMKTIIVTGAAGFIGDLVCQNFFECYKIIAVDKKQCYSDINNENYVPISGGTDGDITNINFWKDMCKKYVPDVIVHCAEMANQNYFLYLNKNENFKFLILPASLQQIYAI